MYFWRHNYYIALCTFFALFLCFMRVCALLENKCFYTHIWARSFARASLPYTQKRQHPANLNSRLDHILALHESKPRRARKRNRYLLEREVQRTACFLGGTESSRGGLYDQRTHARRGENLFKLVSICMRIEWNQQRAAGYPLRHRKQQRATHHLKGAI